MYASILTDLILNKNEETKPDAFLMYTLRYQGNQPVELQKCRS